jgi:hypothetical protein
MGFGQSLSFLNACVAIGLSVLSPLAGYPRQSDKADNEIIVSPDDSDPGNQLAEHIQPTIATSKSKTDESRSAEVKSDPSTSSGVALRNLLPIADPKKPTMVEKAYLDAYTILKEDNSCSRFYSGPSAISALNQLVRSLTSTYFNRAIALRMRGTTAWVQDYRTGRQYRLFEKAEVNLNSSFYKGNASVSEPRTPTVGYFQPNTREARVTILLHELGHLLPKSNKEWVLPDDGADPEISRQNTNRVIEACRDQINGLSHLSFEQELVGARTPASPQNATVEVAQSDPF